jgi:MFS family permease
VIVDSAPPTPAVPLWRNRDYMLLWSGQAVSTLGGGISELAFPLLVLALTRSPAQAGFVAAVTGLPYLLISLPAGALVDRLDRKRVMLVCDTVRAINIGSIPLAAALGHLSIAQIYVNAGVEGTFFVFFNVAEVAALPRVVDKSQIPNATSQNQAAQAGTALVSPPLGGFLFQTVSHSFPFLLDAVSYGFSVLSLLFIKTEFQLERTAEQRRLWVEIREGLQWLWNQPLIRFMTFLTGGLNFAGNATFLILLILAKQKGASPALIGVMFAITSIGGLAGSLIAPRIQKRFGYAQVIITCVWIGALVIPLFTLAPNLQRGAVQLSGVAHSGRAAGPGQQRSAHGGVRHHSPWHGAGGCADSEYRCRAGCSRLWSGTDRAGGDHLGESAYPCGAVRAGDAAGVGDLQRDS